MASNKIDDMVVNSAPAGTELLFASSSGTPKSMTLTVAKQFVIDAIEALTAITGLTGADSVFTMQGGVMGSSDIDDVAQHAIDTIWGKAAIVTPVDADVMVIEDGGVEKTVLLSVLATYILGAIEARLIDVSDVSDGSGTIATTDYMLVTQTTTGKRIQISDLSTLIYASLAAHVTGKAGVVTAAGTDELYFVRGGTGDKMTLAELATYVAAQATLNGTGTADYIAKWTDSDTLEAGYSVKTSGGDMGAGSDTEFATTKTIREELDDLITDGVVAEIYIPASRMFSLVTGGAPASAVNEYITSSMTLDYIAFDGAAVERVGVQLVMPPGWDRGTVKFKLHWSSATGSTAGDTVEWLVGGGAYGDGDSLTDALGAGVTISDTLLADNGADLQVTGATGAVTIANSPALGDTVMFIIFRNVSGTDDMTEDAWLFGVTIQYTEDKVVTAWA